jgi:hypothetical protein
MANPFNDADIVLDASAPPWPASSVDDLICAYECHASTEQAARVAKLQIASQLAALAPMSDGCRTVRLRGEHRRIKLEYPEPTFDQSQLKEVWNSFPKYRDLYLGIATLRVRLREFKKLLHESGGPDFSLFKQMLQSAQRESQGLPRISIEP